jgi:hypothetical protein
LDLKVKLRTLAWVSFVTLTAGLILLPVELRYDLRMSPLQLFEPVTHPRMFSVVFIFWTFLAVAIVLLQASERRERSVVLALILFTLVFSGWHALVTRTQVGDVFMPLSDVRTIASQGRIGPVEDLRYGGYPGFAVLASVLDSTTALQFPYSSTAFVLIQMVGYTITLYAWFRKQLKDVVISGLAVIIAIEGNQAVAVLLSSYHPGALAPLAMFSACLLTLHLPVRGARLLLYGLFLAVITTTHLATAVLLILVMGGRVILGRRRGDVREIWLYFALTVVMVSFWLAYRVPSMLRTLADYAEYTFSEVVTHGRLVGWLVTPSGLAAGERYAPWMLFVQYFWPTVLGLIASLLALYRLTGRGQMTRDDHVELAGMVGVWGISVAALVTGGLANAFVRALVYVGFFATPLLLSSMARRAQRTPVLIATALVLAVLALPSYLYYFRGAPAWTYYPAETAGGRFLEGVFDQGESVRLFGVSQASYYLLYYLPKAKHEEVYYHMIRSQDRDETLARLEFFGRRFLNRSDGAPAVMDFSRRWAGLFPVPLDAHDSLRWNHLRAQLSPAHAIYDNGAATYFLIR